MSEREDLPALPTDIASMLGNERERLDAPSRTVEARLWGKLAANIGGGEGGSSDGAPPAPATPSHVGASPSLAGKIAPYLATLVGGAVIGAVVHAELRPPKLVTVERAVAAVERDARVLQVAPPAVAAPSASVASVSIDTLPTVVVAPPAAPPSVAVDTFVLERRMLDAARVALANGDTTATFEKIEAHARTYPQGRFAEEREALRVRALADAGRKDEARAAATRFEQRWPDSVLLPAVHAALK